MRLPNWSRAAAKLLLVASKSVFTLVTSPLTLFTSSMLALVASWPFIEFCKSANCLASYSLMVLAWARARDNSLSVSFILSVTTLSSPCI